MKKILTQSRLKELLEYNQETGVFVWLVSKSRSAKVGDEAGVTKSAIGYCRIGVDGVRYTAHRLAWLYVNGCFPDADVDHINRVRSDNRISNLRVVSRSENLQNKVAGSQNKSGHKGVCWHKKAAKWVAQIKAENQVRYLGLFENLEDASMAYSKAAAIRHTCNPSAYKDPS